MTYFGRYSTPGPGWNIAGTEEHATEAAFSQRVQRANVRLAGNLRATMNRNTKANRERYGVESTHASITIYAHADPAEIAKVLGVAAWLPGFDPVVEKPEPEEPEPEPSVLPEGSPVRPTFMGFGVPSPETAYEQGFPGDGVPT